jgi:hypothetical protein
MSTLLPYNQTGPTTLLTGEEGPGPTTLATGEETDNQTYAMAENPFGEF